MPAREGRLVNITKQAVIASILSVALTPWQRLVGLLNRDGLQEGEGLLLPRCRSIHTLFMRFPIDVVFLDRAWRVVALRSNIKPGRILAPVFRACSVIELPSGTLQALPIHVGDRLAIEEPAVR